MLTKEEADAIKVMIKDWPSPEPGAFGVHAAQVLIEAIERETEAESGIPDMHGIVLGPVIKDGKLTHIRVEFRDAPGIFTMVSVAAAAEIRDGFNYLLKVRDWEAYSREFGWLDGSPPRNE